MGRLQIKCVSDQTEMPMHSSRMTKKARRLCDAASLPIAQDRPADP